MKNYLVSELCGNTPGVEKMPRSKSKVVDLFGKSYWHQMSEKEFQIAKDKAFFKVEGIHDKEAL